MVNIIAAYQQNGMKGGYLTPRINVGAQNAPALAPTQAFQVERQTMRGFDADPWWLQAGKYMAAIPPDLADSTVALFGGERGATNSEFWNGLGMPGMAAWVEQNHGGVEVASGLAGAIGVGVAAEFAAVRAVTSGLFAATGVGRAVAPMILSANRAQTVAKEAALAAARTGEVLHWTAPVNLRYLGLATRNVALKSAVSEAAIVATLNKNSFIWSDDNQNNIVMAALGIAIPSFATGVFGRAEIYRWANSEQMRAAVAVASDPKGLQAGAQATANFNAVPKIPASTRPVNPSYVLTQYALDARLDDSAVLAKTGAPVNPNRDAIKVELTARQNELAQQITKRGIDAVEDSKFSMLDAKGGFSPAGKHIAEALHEDPTVFLGLRSAGLSDPEIAISTRKAWRDRMWRKKGVNSNAEKEVMDGIKTETPLVMVGKKLLGTDEGIIYARHKPDAKFSNRLTEGAQEIVWKPEHGGRSIRVREDGRVSGVKWSELQAQDVLTVRDAMREQLTQMGRKKIPLVVPKDVSPIELDFAIEYAARGGTVDFQMKAGITDVADAKLKSVQRKAESLKGKKVLTAEDRIRHNLPLATSLERMNDPDGSALLQLIQSSKNAKSIQDLEKARKEIYQRFDLTSDVQFEGRMDGDLFNFGFSRDGQYLPPITMFYTDVPTAKWSKWDVQQATIEGHTIRLSQLRRPRKSAFVSTVVDQLLSFPELNLLKDVRGLMSSQIGGTSSVGSAVASSFLTQAQRFRNNPILLAAQRFKRELNRLVQGQIDIELATMSGSLEKILSPASVKSKIMFDTYMSTVVGWEIKGAKQLPDGKIGFLLDHESARNMRRAGREIAKGDLLLNPRTGQPVVLDDLGNQLRQDWEKVADKLLDAQNAVREARGLEPRKKRAFYAMPKSTRGKIVGFTLGPDNRVVEGGAIVASTEAEFRRMAAKLRSEFKPGDGKRFMRQDEIARFADLWDQADIDFIDPTAMAGPGGVQSGGLASDFIDATSAQRMLQYVKDGYENLGNGITRTMFTEQLKLAEAYSKAGQLTHPQAKGTKNIHEIYMETLLGMPSRMNPGGLVKIMGQVDESIDAFMQQFQGNYTTEHMRSMLGMAGVDANQFFSSKQIKTFEDLSREMADYMPFKDVADYADYTLGMKVPWKSRDMARKVNQFGTAAILRWGEFTHAAMNMAGIISNMPGVLGAKNLPVIGQIGGVGVVDTAKIMARGFKRMLAEGDKRVIGQKLSPDYEYMVKNGDTSQQAAEFDIAFGQLKPGNHSRWNKFFMGDPSAPHGSSANKGVDGWMSVVTDTSESASRRWAHFIGLELADHAGVRGMDARHTFAREIANQAIANYDPWNRPEIYQSAMGSMYGLFLSYAQNYYQRIWSWMEVGDYKAIGRTLAMQSALFGFGGMPGTRQLAALIGGEEDGEGLMDGIYERFGPAVGSVVAQGGFNQLTTILGLPAVALHTRGDTNFRHPTLDFATSGILRLPVGLEVMKDTIDSVFKSTGAMFGPGGGRQAAETFAYYMPSRVLSGVVSVLGAEGDEVDAYGNLISDTENLGETAYRLLGFRSARQQGAIEGYYMNQRALQIDAERMDGVRKEARALVRAKNFDDLPAIFDSYLEAGGKPWNYSTWIRGIMKDASQTRSTNQLMRSMRNPAHQDLARRIELMTAAY